jgi:hypothetical protein
MDDDFSCREAFHSAEALRLRSSFLQAALASVVPSPAQS